MSGHSKWSQIKHKKGIADQKKAKIFSKLARSLTIAAKIKGHDPALNIQLRSAIEKAQEMIDKSGQMGVPVIDIGGKIIVGFNKPVIDPETLGRLRVPCYVLMNTLRTA